MTDVERSGAPGSLEIERLAQLCVHQARWYRQMAPSYPLQNYTKDAADFDAIATLLRSHTAALPSGTGEADALAALNRVETWVICKALDVPHDGSCIADVATVMKDRSDTMDGQSFTDPTYATFRPFFGALNIGGVHNPTDATRTSDHLFASPDNAIERKRLVEITLEKVTAALVLAGIGSQSTADKKRMRELFQECFGTPAWSEIETLRLPRLQEGLAAMRLALGQTVPALEPDEIDAIRDLTHRANELGVLTKQDRAKLLADVISGDPKAIREKVEEIRLAVEKSKLAPVGIADPDFSKDLGAPALPF